MDPILDQQLAHMEWADARLWTSVLALAATPRIEPIRDLLHHLHLVQRLYLQIWRGEPLTMSKPKDFADLESLCRWAREPYAPARRLVADCTAEDLEREVRFPWEKAIVERFGSAIPATLRESVVQVVIHTAHHRAQICTRIREAGGEPPLVDFIAWIWMGHPAPAWP